VPLHKYNFRVSNYLEKLKEEFDYKSHYFGRYESKNIFTNLAVYPYRYNFHTEWFPNKYKSQFFHYEVIEIIKKKKKT